MGLEIEHKYLIHQAHWQTVVPHKSTVLKQAYISTDPEKTIRVRTLDDKAYITIKGKSSGAARLEFEYEIPLEDAYELIKHFSANLVEKTRHYVLVEGKTWEVDEFKGANKGLFVAEIELDSEDEAYHLPEWVDRNVTNDMRYANSNLALNPYTNW
jgi:adenylate cyclase